MEREPEWLCGLVPQELPLTAVGRWEGSGERTILHMPGAGEEPEVSGTTAGGGIEKVAELCVEQKLRGLGSSGQFRQVRVQVFVFHLSKCWGLCLALRPCTQTIVTMLVVLLAASCLVPQSSANPWLFVGFHCYVALVVLQNLHLTSAGSYSFLTAALPYLSFVRDYTVCTNPALAERPQDWPCS